MTKKKSSRKRAKTQKDNKDNKESQTKDQEEDIYDVKIKKKEIKKWAKKRAIKENFSKKEISIQEDALNLLFSISDKNYIKNSELLCFIDHLIKQLEKQSELVEGLENTVTQDEKEKAHTYHYNLYKQIYTLKELSYSIFSKIKGTASIGKENGVILINR